MITVDLRGDVRPDWAPTYAQRSLVEIRRAMAIVSSGAAWGQLPTLLMVLTVVPEDDDRSVDDTWWDRVRLLTRGGEDQFSTHPTLVVLDGRADQALTGLIADAEAHAPRAEAGIHVIGLALVLDRSVPAGERGAYGDETDTRRDRREAWALYASGAMLRLCVEHDPDRVIADYWAPDDVADRPTGPLLSQLWKLLRLYCWMAPAASATG